MAKKFARTKENLEFIDSVRKALGNEQQKSFGLYVNLFKKFGREKMARALSIAMEKPEAYRLRYFLGVLMHERSERKVRRQAVPTIPKNAKGEGLLHLKAQLLKKMAPPYERISRKRARLVVRIAREERKLRRGKPKKHGTRR